MKYLFERAFEKDFTKLKDKKLAQSIIDIIENITAAQSIRDIKKIKKLSGHTSAYRIRSGEYRIGIFIENNTVIFAAFSHRKDIYKKFP